MGNAKLLPAAHHGARAPLCQEPPSGWCLSMPSSAPAVLMKGPNLCHGVPPAAALLVSMETPPSYPYGDSPGTHSQKKPSKSTSLLDENSPLLCFSLKLPAEVPDSLYGCSSCTIFGSHPAHTALQGAPGWDRIPSASVPADPAIPASCWAEMLPKRTLSLGGQIFAKDQAKAHLAPHFRSAVVFREVVKPLHSYLSTPVTGKDTQKSPLGSGESQAHSTGHR